MREAAVTAALQRHLASGPQQTGKPQRGGASLAGGGGGSGGHRPVVFMLITSGANHGGATLHLSYRAYQLPAYNAGGAQLQAVELAVINLAKVLSAAHGCDAFQAPALAAVLAGSGGGAGLPAAVERRLREAAGGAAWEVADAVCGAMLGELRELADKVGRLF
jgi:hypothetical protein